MGEEELKIIEGLRFLADAISWVYASNIGIVCQIDAINNLSDAAELPEELERVLDCIASTGNAPYLTWARLKLVLHKKIDIVITMIYISPAAYMQPSNLFSRFRCFASFSSDTALPVK